MDPSWTAKHSTIVSASRRFWSRRRRIKRIIQNYANLTLEDMHFFAEHQADGEDYALSFNNGSIIFKAIRIS